MQGPGPAFSRLSLERLCWSPDEIRLISWGEDGAGHLWEGRSGQELAVAVWLRPGGWAMAAWSSDGKLLATGDESRARRLWDDNSGQELVPLRGQSGAIRAVA